MAKAKPIVDLDAQPEAPAVSGEERMMPPAEQAAARVTAPGPAVLGDEDAAALEAMRAEAEAAGMKASIVGNAVRIDL